jgi:hypothetical protein
MCGVCVPLILLCSIVLLYKVCNSGAERLVVCSGILVSGVTGLIIELFISIKCVALEIR